MKKLGLFAIITLVALTLVSCSTKEDNSRKSAMLMYMDANNSLTANLKDNLNTILSNFVPSEEKDIFIFFKGSYGSDLTPKLYKIVKKKKGEGGELSIVKSYNEGLISASATTLNLIMSDVSALPNITTIEDIILSSHAGSWLPFKNVPTIVRGFGDDATDKTQVIEIDQMAKVFEQYNLNSITFDACFMSSIEVLYQLRNSAKYILASPAEVLAAGIDYTFATKYFTQKMTKETLITIANATNELYKSSSKPDLFFHSNTLTVTECAYLEDFGKLAKDIVKYDQSKVNFEIATKVTYDADGKFASDYKEYLYKLIEKYGNSSEKTLLDAAWAKAFVHYAHTDFLLGKIDLTNSYGVAGYIYKEKQVSKIINDYYSTLDWGKLVQVSPR